MLTLHTVANTMVSSFNKKTGQGNISPYPESNIGAPSSAKKYRFQWTYPIVFRLTTQKNVCYLSGCTHDRRSRSFIWNYKSWFIPKWSKTTGETGGPITKDQTGAEVYATIFTLRITARKGVIWTGSDDGLVHITKNDGAKWENISLPTTLLPDFSLISMIHTSEHEKEKHI
jgi:hypothetical protein